MRLAIACVFSAGIVLYAETDVTSREAFSRLSAGSLPSDLHYNSDRASLELRADDVNCPSAAHGFFELKINEQGQVTKARGISVSPSPQLKDLKSGWVRHLLMQIRFRPLSLGSKTASVHTFTSVVCR